MIEINIILKEKKEAIELAFERKVKKRDAERLLELVASPSVSRYYAKRIEVAEKFSELVDIQSDILDVLNQQTAARDAHGRH